MKDKIARAKEIIQQHRNHLTFTSGVVVGAGAVMLILKKDDAIIWLGATSDDFQKLIDNPEGGLRWMEAGREIILANQDHPNLAK